MSEHFPAEIHIGGPIPRAVLAKLIAAALAEDASLRDYGEAPATKESLKDAFREGQIVSLYDDQARYGHFPDLEDFLVKHGIHFDRHGDSFCEFNAENVYYRGGPKTLVMLADESGNPLASCQEIQKVLDHPSMPDRGKLKAIRRRVSPRQMAKLTPIRFV